MDPVAFGEYSLIEKIAEGGMAELFLAKRRGLEGFEKIVAIKRILPELSQNREFVSMFINEAKIAARLSHPNIVQIFDFGKVGDYYFIAMEYVHGENLRTILQSAVEHSLPMPQHLAAAIVARSCAGLDHAHKKTDESGRPLGIVHRDVSPQNVLVSYEGEVKVVDFGIAKAVAENPEVTRGVLKGKLSYLSPEQILGKPLDGRSDVFSIGTLLYELLTGQKLFHEPGAAEVLDAIVRVDSADVARSVPDAPRGLRDVLRRALAANPEDRFESAGAMQRGLDEYLRQQDPRGTLDLANYMRALFHDRMKVGAATLGRLREEILSHGKRPRVRMPSLPPRVLAAAAGALAGIVAVGIAVPALPHRGEIVAGVPPLPAARPEPAKEAPKVAAIAPEPVPREDEGARADAQIERARDALAAGSVAKAVSAFEAAFRIDPSLRARHAAAYAEALVRDGKRLFDEDSREAEQRFRAALRIDPDLYDAHFFLAKIYTRRSEVDAAGREYLEAIRIDPNAPDPHFNLGFIYFSQKQYEDALREYEQTAKLEPRYLADVFYNISACYERLGKKREAREVLRRGVAAVPDSDLLKKRLKQLGG
ncbi:MAG: eukaryotic-like serine/threonine-protein kinase [Candidatus Binatota bacterium]|nr:eukaryotic-like serine/threonine-protein kinase [Candidatus Binatota bacterium]